MSQSVLLAPNQSVPFNKLRYPLLVSRKFDGHRLIIIDGKLLTRSLKPHPNRHLASHLREIIEFSRNNGRVFDGELYDHVEFHKLQSIFRSYDAPIPPSVQFHVFDTFPSEVWTYKLLTPPFRRRVKIYEEIIEQKKFPNVQAVEQTPCYRAEDAEDAMDLSLAEGYEGLMLRDPHAPYKFGRATLGENIIYKFKEWVTIDATIIGVTHKMRMKDEVRNGERERDERGLMKRIHTQASYETTQEVGSFQVILPDGVVTHVTQARGVCLAKNVDEAMKLINQKVEIRYQRVGTKDRPRMGAITRLRPDLMPSPSPTLTDSR